MRNHFIKIFLLFFLISIQAFSIDKLDSLLNRVNNATDIEKINIYNQIGSLYSKIQPFKAIRFYKEALVYAQKAKKIKEEYKILINISKKYREIEEYVLAIEYLNKALEIATEIKDKDYQLDVYNELSINYFNLKKYDVSIKYFNSYIHILEENLDKNDLSIAYNNIANIYRIEKNYEKAFEYCFNAEKFLIDIGDSVSLATTLNNIALIYQEIENYNKAWEYFYRAESIADRHKVSDVQLNIYGNIANLAFYKQNYTIAKNYFEKMIVLAKKTHNFNSLHEVYEQISNLYEMEGDNKSALENYKLSVMYKDSMTQKSIEEQTNELKIIYETDKKFQENKILKQKNHIQSLKSERQENITIFIVVILVLLLIVAIILINRFNLARKHNKVLELKNSEIEEMNQELKALNKELEERVKERTVELSNEIKDKIQAEKKAKEALKAVQKANDIKDNFLSNISHEVRTPLNAILGLSGLLSEKLAEGDEDVKLYTNGIVESSNRLLHMLNNIIDFSTFQTDELHFEQMGCLMPDIIQGVVNLFEFKINEKGLDIEVVIPDSLPLVNADCKYVSRVLYDIIDNAVKYTEQGSLRIKIEDFKENEEICIIVSDTGIGIGQEYLPHIFDTFSQEQEGYSREYQGAGLGLPLAKKLIEYMGGRIEISSSKGKGTMVRINLKYSNKSNDMHESVSAEDMYVSNEILKESGIEILVVEDDSFNAIILEEILLNISTPTVVDDPEKVLEIVKRYKDEGNYFNIMLIDINLPGQMDGIELMHKIKEIDKKYNNIPFIAQTAYAMSSDREKLLKSGFDDYIAKPIDHDELLLIIKSKLV